MIDESRAEVTLDRSVGLGLLTFYGIGVMVGAGIFVLIGEIAAGAGAMTPATFLLAGLAAALSALSYAELSSRLPESAGEAAFAREAFGRAWLSIAIGLAVAAVGVISSAAILKGGVGYLLAFVDAPRWALEIGVGLALTAVAARGILESMWLVGVLTALSLAGLAMVIWAGFSAAPAMDWGPMLDLGTLASPGMAQVVLSGALLSFFAYVGFENMVNLAEETKEPERTMPLGIFLAVGLTTAIYVTVAVAALRAVPPEALGASERPLALVWEAGMGSPAPAFLLIVALFATLNGILAQIVMSSRVLYGLGRTYGAFRWAHRLHPRWRTPVGATLAAAAVMFALAMAAPIGDLAAATSTLLLGIFAVVNAALLVLKRRGPPPEGAPNVPRVVPLAAIALSAALIAA